jgi:hypothetical protein
MKKLIKLVSAGLIISVCLLMISNGISAAETRLKSDRRVAARAVTSSNSIYKLTVEDQIPGSGIGTFTVGTATNHPNPNQNVLYGGAGESPGTSYLTIRSFTSQTDYISTADGGLLSDYTIVNLDNFSPTVSPLGTTGSQVTWPITGRDDLSVQQVTDVEGTTYENSRLRVTTTVTNNGTTPVDIGIRYQWDWMVGGSDDSWFRAYNPTGPWTDVFESFINPPFLAYEITDDPASPLFSVYGTVNGPGTLSPQPTPPNMMAYVRWSIAYSNVWEFAVTGSDADSATCYYWSPITLAPGATIAVTQYITTAIEVIGPPPAPRPIPTMSEWGMIIMALILAGSAIWMMRRRQVS